jgi:gluconolactonase
MRLTTLHLASAAVTLSLGLACSPSSNDNGGQGGNTSTGGTSTGGTATGGSTPTTGGTTTTGGSAPTGGTSSGGVPNTGGTSTGGTATTGGSNATGGTSSGGSSTGGSATGGTSTGGSSTGGAQGGNAGQGGSATGGAGGTQGGAGNGRFTCPTVTAGMNPLPSTVTPTVVAGVPPADSFNNNNNDFKILEGPVWYNGALYLSEIKNGSAPPPARVLKVTSTGTVSVAIPADMAGTNGLATDAMGRLLGANHTQGAIVRLDPTGAAAPTVIVGMYMGARFNSPNDLAVRSDGNIYFTDPQHQAGSARMTQRVYRVAPGASMATLVQDNANGPNGISLSADENTLFVSHGPDAGGIDKYPVMADGSLGSMASLTSSFNSDGMGVDCAGNLYLSQQNKIVIISSTTGQKVGEIPVADVQATTNVAFGGPENKTLYITSLGNNAKLLKIDLLVPGLPY